MKKPRFSTYSHSAIFLINKLKCVVRLGGYTNLIKERQNLLDDAIVAMRESVDKSENVADAFMLADIEEKARDVDLKIVGNCYKKYNFQNKKRGTK